MKNEEVTRSGFIAIVGRPNVGKSTLLNQILGKKLSITSPKPQTTRQQLHGIKTIDNIQMIFVDTPGLHLGAKKVLNKYMNAAARSALVDVDVVVMMVDSLIWRDEDEFVLELIKDLSVPKLLVVNKVDLIKNKEEVLPHLSELAQKTNFTEIIPLSAQTGKQCDTLIEKLKALMPEGPFYYPETTLSNRSQGFHLSEIVREQLMYQLGSEVPYSATVSIEALEEVGNLVKVAATVWVEREGQKAIVIGDKGDKMKNIGQRARHEMEIYLGKKVYLQLWVKVKDNWSDDKKSLDRLGYFSFD